MVPIVLLVLLAAAPCTMHTTPAGERMAFCRDPTSGVMCITRDLTHTIDTRCADGSRSVSRPLPGAEMETITYDPSGRVREICVTRKGGARDDCRKP